MVVPTEEIIAVSTAEVVGATDTTEEISITTTTLMPTRIPASRSRGRP